MTPDDSPRIDSPRKRWQSPTHPSEHSKIPERSPDAPKPGESIPSHYRHCFGCGVEHESGLHMQMTAGTELDVQGIFMVTEHHQGAPGLAHGGLLTAAMDEVLGSLNWLLARPAVTGRLECDFKKPVPVGSQLFISARITGVDGRKIYTRATANLGSLTGPLVIEAAALFVQVGVQHFLTYGNPDEVNRALRDGSAHDPSWRPLAPELTAEQREFGVNP